MKQANNCTIRYYIRCVLDWKMHSAGIGWLIVLHFVFIELSLGVIGFLGVLLVLALNSTTGIVLNAVAFVVSLALWLLTVCCANRVAGGDNDWCCLGEDPEARGAAVLNSRVVYFFNGTVAHLISLLAWIVYAIKFGALDPVNETTNVGAFVVRTLLHLLMLVVFLAMFATLITELRRVSRRPKQSQTTPL